MNNIEKNASHKALKAQKESKTQTKAITELQHYYSRLPVTRTLYNSNLPQTQSNFHIPSDRFLYNFSLDNSNFFLFPLKVRIYRESTVLLFGMEARSQWYFTRRDEILKCPLL